MRATAAGSGNLLVWVFCGIPRARDLTIGLATRIVAIANSTTALRSEVKGD